MRMRTNQARMGVLWAMGALMGCGDAALMVGTDGQGPEPTLPRITSFAATRVKAESDGSTRITWTWTLANSSSLMPECTVDHGIGPVTKGSETVVTLTKDTDFTLTCANSAGSDWARYAVKAPRQDVPDPDPACGPHNCGGCCDVDEVCQDGTGDAVCGSLGAACVDCTPTEGSCESKRCTKCAADCSSTTCGDSDGCGDTCKAGSGCCEPACSGKICGAANGCGGTCGSGSGCCTPTCEGKTCGEPDGCDGTCKTSSGCCTPKCEGKMCGADDGCAGTCTDGHGCCEPKCEGTTCGASNGCGGTCKAGSGCCEPKCLGTTCGASNGCGGTCKAGSGCCTPKCSGKVCGASDGCGGTCNEGEGCCTPKCSGKVCGAGDGCGSTCKAGSGCCTPKCSGKACGDSDGCGGFCSGSCDDSNAICTSSAGGYACTCEPEFKPIDARPDECMSVDLVTNGEFSNGISGWNPVSHRCQAGWAPAGNHSATTPSGWAQIRCDADPWGGLGFSRLWQCVPVTAGKTYWLESSIRGTTTAELTSSTIPNLLNTLGVAFYDNATCGHGLPDAAISQVEAQAGSNIAWKLWGFLHDDLWEITAPSRATHAMVYLQTASTDMTTASTGLWDYVRLRRRY